MTADENLESLLKHRTRFSSLCHVDRCDSTQDLAVSRPAASGATPPDAVFWADHQLRGRGRRQRPWHDETGRDLAVTFRVTTRLANPVELPAALPVAVLEACEPLVGRRLRIKWPNDVYAHAHKLSGVLVDRDSRLPDTYRIGVGLNVNRTSFPAELIGQATSLRLLADRTFERHDVLLSLAESIDAMLTAIERQQLTDHERTFRERLELVGHRVDVEVGGEQHHGLLSDIDFECVQLDGTRRLPLALVTSLRRTAPAN